MRALRACLLALVALGAACDEHVYPCHNDGNCVVLGAEGKCLSAGSASYCAFPYQQLATSKSPNPIFCPSGYRWDTSAPEEIQGSCVVPSQKGMNGGVGAVDGGAD